MGKIKLMWEQLGEDKSRHLYNLHKLTIDTEDMNAVDRMIVTLGLKDYDSNNITRFRWIREMTDCNLVYGSRAFYTKDKELLDNLVGVIYD